MHVHLTLTLPGAPRSLVFAGALAIGCAIGVGVARADAPLDGDALVYSGVLEENGVLIGDSSEPAQRNINVQIFDAAVSGTQLCETDDQTVEVVRGRFRVALPAACAVAMRASAAAFVDVKVGGIALGARTRVGAVPFAVEAGSSAVANAAATGSALEDVLADQPIITSWAPYNAALSIFGAGAVANQTTTGLFRRVGDSIDVRIQSTFNAFPNQGGTFTWGLPPGFVVDNQKMPNGNQQHPAGFGVVANATNSVKITVSSSSNGALVADSGVTGSVAQSTPFAIDAQTTIFIEASVPIDGFDATRGL